MTEEVNDPDDDDGGDTKIVKILVIKLQRAKTAASNLGTNSYRSLAPA